VGFGAGGLGSVGFDAGEVGPDLSPGPGALDAGVVTMIRCED
jgi:hypothetical protein